MGCNQSLFGGKSRNRSQNAEKPKEFDVSGAVVWAEASNTTNAYFGGNADVRSGGSVLVTSEIEDDFRTSRSAPPKRPIRP